MFSVGYGRPDLDNRNLYLQIRRRVSGTGMEPAEFLVHCSSAVVER